MITMSEDLKLAIVVLLFCVLLFFLLREVICWYYKINKMINIQSKQNELLQQILNKLSGDRPEEAPKNKSEN